MPDGESMSPPLWMAIVGLVLGSGGMGGLYGMVAWLLRRQGGNDQKVAQAIERSNEARKTAEVVGDRLTACTQELLHHQNHTDERLAVLDSRLDGVAKQVAAAQTKDVCAVQHRRPAADEGHGSTP